MDFKLPCGKSRAAFALLHCTLYARVVANRPSSRWWRVLRRQVADALKSFESAAFPLSPSFLFSITFFFFYPLSSRRTNLICFGSSRGKLDEMRHWSMYFIFLYLKKKKIFFCLKQPRRFDDYFSVVVRFVACRCGCIQYMFQMI